MLKCEIDIHNTGELDTKWLFGDTIQSDLVNLTSDPVLQVIFKA